MNYNEIALERAGYDNWKLSNNEDEMKIDKTMQQYLNKDEKDEVINCPCCEEEITDRDLFVEEEKILYHYSCYNYMKKDEKKDDDDNE